MNWFLINWYITIYFRNFVKPVKLYYKSSLISKTFKDLERFMLIPVREDNVLQYVLTSQVIMVNNETGEFETLNTLYRPYED